MLDIFPLVAAIFSKALPLLRTDFDPRLTLIGAGTELENPGFELTFCAES